MMHNYIITHNSDSQDGLQSQCDGSPLLLRAERTGGDLAVSGYTRAGDADGVVPSASPVKLNGGVDDLRQAWGDMIDRIGDDLGGWEWYCTLTFRDPDEKQRAVSPTWTKPGWGYAHKGLRQFTKTLMDESFGGIQPWWIACMEYQKRRGVPHWHLLMGGMDGKRRLSWMDWWYEGYGIARILEYNHELGAKYYLGKYLTKEMADIQFSPQLRAKHRSAVAR